MQNPPVLFIYPFIVCTYYAITGEGRILSCSEHHKNSGKYYLADEDIFSVDFTPSLFWNYK